MELSKQELGRVAIVINDLTEFFAVKDNLDALSREGVSCDIFVADHLSKEMYRDTKQNILKLGYEVANNKEKAATYQVLLDPYPSTFSNAIPHMYRIKYSYGASSAKPKPTYSVEWNLPYDASIMHSKRDAEIRNVYGKAYVVPYRKYKGFKKKKTKFDKPALLYLPTFGDASSIDTLNDSVVEEIKKEYTLVIKAHHAVQFRESESGRYERIKSVADVFYNSDTPLERLLARADVVLSDNSGAIFEAIYAGVPVAVFSNKLNEFKLGNVNTFQYDLVKEGVIPCAEHSEDVLHVIQEAAKLAKKQNQAKARYFISNDDEVSRSFVSIIQEYLLKDKEKDLYSITHDSLRDAFYESTLKTDDLLSKVGELQSIIKGYETSFSWKITRPLREFNKIVKRRKNERV